MKTINELYEDRHKTNEVKIDERKTLNDLFEEKAKERESLKEEKKPVTQKKVVYARKKLKKKSGIWYEIEYFFWSFTNAEKAITITLFIMFCLVISMLAVQLHNREKEIMIEMSLTPDMLEPEMPEPEKPLEEEKAEVQSNSKVTISAYNESDMSLQHSDQALKSLDEILAEREMQEAANSDLLTSNAPTSDFVLPSEMLDKEKKLKQKEEVVNKNALVKYALADRTLRGELPNPIFTCERYGKVVVTIKVNEAGYVVEATIDKVNSTTTDGCVIDNALRYAQQAQFNAVSGRGVQVGSITYSFQQKR